MNNSKSYIKAKYVGTIHLKNPSTGKTEEIPIERTVYRNVNINPDLVIPSGTVIGKEVTKCEMTNLDRMKNGQSPLILVHDENGNVSYDRVELHHLTSEERKQQTLFFNGEKTDGTLVEMQSSHHKKYHKQLHAINESNNSFRKEKNLYVDENGQEVRKKVKTYDAYQYDTFRSSYWKDRAAEYEMEKVKTGGIEMDRYQDKSPEEQRKIEQRYRNAVNRWKAKTNAKKASSSEEEGKEQRQRDRGKEHANNQGQSK